MSPARKPYISGPSLQEPIPDCSVAEYFIPLLRTHPKDNVIQIDALTGRAETSLEVLTKSIKVSEGYRRLGCTQDDVFCLAAHNSSDVFAAALGVWWFGGVLAALDPQWNVQEFTSMFGKVKPSVIICEEGVLEKVTAVVKSRGEDVKMIVLAERERVKAPHIPFEDLLDIEVDVDSYKPMPVDSPSTKVVLAVPTSGSTGISKAVGLTHRNMIFQTLSLKETNVEYACRSVLVTSHFYWITCTLGLIISLSTGMTRIYLTHVNPRNILKAAHRYKPEWLIMGPGYFSQLLREPDIDQYDLSGFKLIALGGSALTQAIPERLKKIGIKLPLANIYGTSEMSGTLCRTGVHGSLENIGRPSPGIKLKIVDPDTGSTLGSNQTGEIWVSSPGAMKGYIGDEEATKAIFVDGWIRTGDLGYYDEDEIFYIVDRMKEMIKDSHDRQIAPSEIEGVIESIPGVQEAGVVGLFREAYVAYLVGLVVKGRGSSLTEEDVKTAVNENLAHYKHVERVVFVEELPRSNVGKLRRRALKEMALSLVGEG